MRSRHRTGRSFRHFALLALVCAMVLGFLSGRSDRCRYANGISNRCRTAQAANKRTLKRLTGAWRWFEAKGILRHKRSPVSASPLRGYRASVRPRGPTLSDGASRPPNRIVQQDPLRCHRPLLRPVDGIVIAVHQALDDPCKGWPIGFAERVIANDE